MVRVPALSAAGERRQPLSDLARLAKPKRPSGVSLRTVTRRLDDPAFKQRVRAERDAMVARSVGRLADASTEAVDVLLTVAHDPRRGSRASGGRTGRT
jgi:hypothetical protein